MLGQLEGVVRPFQSEQAFNRALNKEAKEEPREAIAEWGVAGDAEIALVSSFTGFSTLPATNYKEQYRQGGKGRGGEPGRRVLRRHREDKEHCLPGRRCVQDPQVYAEQLTCP